MRSTFITVAMGVAGMLLVAQVASANDTVQEQLRLMEQRMAEMEDRLQATSTELQSAQATVEDQQVMLTDAGLIEAAEEDSGLRSGIGNFVEMVDISGVAAASFNYRLLESENQGNLAGGTGFFKNPNANTFQVDQIWMILDKAPTEESRAGFHAEFVTGEAAQAQSGGGNNDDTPFLYSGYVSYLAPILNGVQIDLGKLATPLGAEVVQTNGNFFVTQGAVFGLQPVAHTGVALSTQITDEIGIIAGVVNDVYNDSATSTDNDKAYYGQVSYGGDKFGLNVGGIWGADRGAGNSDANTSVFDVVLSIDPTDNLSFWANFDWVHTSGTDTAASAAATNQLSRHGDAFGVAGAGRVGITDRMGLATRVEYIHTEDSLAQQTDDAELVTLTGTFDARLTEDLVTRVELRWDTRLDDGAGFQARTNGGRTNNDQVVAFWQMYYEF